MLIAELIAPRELRLTEQEIADPGRGEVQARVKAVGICGSDLHSYSEGAIVDMACQYPMVLGHEPSGTLVKMGAGVTGWSIGDRAALEPALYCYHCEFCRTGHHNVCATNWAFQIARNAGRVVLTGIHSGLLVPFEVSPMRRKELAIFNVRRSNHESEGALQLLAHRTAWFAPLVTHTRPLERIAEAFSINEQYADGVGKMVLV